MQHASDESATPVADAGKILDACRRAAWLTKQLLILGHRQMIQPELLDLNALVAEAGELVRRVTRGIELELVLDPALGHIRADQGQAEQLAANLIIHACDNMPDGGKMTIETGKETLPGDDPNHAGPFVVLSVSGAGFIEIPPKLDGLAGELDTSLSIAYETARQMGATIRVAGNSEGTTFSVDLPQVEAAGELLSLDQNSSLYLPETILLVESEDMVRGVMRRVLLQAGCHVLEAELGDEVLDVCAQYTAGPIRVALVEAANDTELIERIASTYPHMQIVVMSGVEPEPGRNGTFLRKPFTHGELLWAVREALLVQGGG